MPTTNIASGSIPTDALLGTMHHIIDEPADRRDIRLPARPDDGPGECQVDGGKDPSVVL
jgi:hypothetical protein